MHSDQNKFKQEWLEHETSITIIHYIDLHDTGSGHYGVIGIPLEPDCTHVHIQLALNSNKV